MKVLGQKNVYYIDLNKNIYRGYVETSLHREPNDKFLVYKSTHLDIESACVVGHQGCLSPEFFSTKSLKEKQKNTKNGKCVVAAKPKGPLPQSTMVPRSSIPSNVLPISKPPGCEEAHTEPSFEAKYSQHLGGCHDAFKLKIPDDIEDAEFKLRVVFRPTPDNPAIMWYKPVHEKDKHKEIIACNFYHNSSCIAPYIDSITDMEMYYVIPNTEEVKVVSSGIFKAIKEEDKTIIYHYSSFCNPRYFMFAVGSYDQNDIFGDSDKRKVLTPFCLESDISEVSNDLQAIIKYIESFTRTTDLSTTNVVFTVINVDNIVAKNMVVLRYNLLGGPKDIETSFLMKRILSDCLSYQVYGFLSWSIYDAWISQGLAGYLSDYCIRYLLGNNEFMHNYKEDKDFVVKNDTVEPPLFYTLRKEQDCFLEFFRRKSKMVFHCMEAQLSFAFLQKISDEVLEARSINEDVSRPSAAPKESATHDSMVDLKRCFTSKFIKIVKDATGKDLRLFFDFYVFRPGLIRVKLSFQINKKKNTVKVAITQSPTSLLSGANRKVPSTVEIKSVELEGLFDHSLNPETENVFLYHTRTKKKKKEDEEDVMPLLYIRADIKRETLFDYAVEQPDYMRIEQLQEKNVIGQLEAVESLREKPTLNTCEALERMLDNTHVFFKIRVRIIYILSSIKIEGYDGLQRLIQYFVRTRCVPNSTVLKGNEFGLISYFIQKHLVKSIASTDITFANVLSNSKIVLAFLENTLKFNDNSLSQFEDSWYISSIINLFGLHLALVTSFKDTFDEDNSASLFKRSSNTEDFLMPVASNEKAEKSRRPAAVVNALEIVEKCVNEIERFRISDMVFPSNNNVVTRSCLISYIRLAFYNKVVISRGSLESLSQYPNLFSIRLVAIEGLLILFSSSIEFILAVASSDTPFMVQSILDIVLKILLLRLNVHFLDTDEFNVDLTDHIRKGLSSNLDSLLGIYRNNFFNLRIGDLTKKIFACLEDKFVEPSEYIAISIKKYDLVKEESNRISLLKTVSMTRRIKMPGLEALRMAAFEQDSTIRLARAKSIKSKKEMPLRSLKIRIRPKKFLIKHTGTYLIRFKKQEKKIKLKKADLPLFLVSRFRDSPYCPQIDESIRKTKATSFFTWSPLTSKQIFDLASQGMLSSTEVFKEIEKALIFVLSYNGTQTKLYSLARSAYSFIEGVYYQYAFIPEKVSPMTPELKEKCDAFLKELKEAPVYSMFLHPVDCTELKNYLDIVRIPVCFEDVSVEACRSFDAFITSLRRIATNCLNYNDSRSLIAQSAMSLLKSVEAFHSSLELTYVDTYDVLQEIISSASLDMGEFSIRKVSSWGDLEEGLASFKKKYSRYSTTGKLHHSAIKLVKAQLNSWFLNDGTRAQILQN